MKKDASRRDSRLAPRWRSVPLIGITRHDVKAWAAELAGDGLAQSRVQRCVHLLSAASLAAAVDAEIIPTNPASRIGVKVGDTTKERFLTQKEAQKLLAELDDDSVDEALVSLLIGTGLRWGEAVGLHIERVDLERGIVRVAEVWDNVNGVMKAYPKSRRQRTVPLPKWVAKKLKPLVRGRADGHVFLSDEGQAIDHSNWRRRIWVPAVAAAGVRALTIHDLRHTYVSWLIQDGVPLEEVGRILGHVSPLTTRRYAHLAETPRELVLAALPDPSKKKAKRGAGVEQKAPKRAGTGLYRAVDNRSGKVG